MDRKCTSLNINNTITDKRTKPLEQLVILSYIGPCTIENLVIGKTIIL